MRVVRNPARATPAAVGGPAPAQAFHAGLPGYAATPLREAPALARAWGVGRVVLKDETARLGLAAFKGLGATWAAHRAVAEAGGDVTLITATDGNHGRALARTGRLLGVPVEVLVPAGTAPARIAAIREEGAAVEVVDGDYDAAVAEAAARAAVRTGGRRVLVQDTAWPGYERVPGWVVEGYETLWAELADQLGAAPDLVLLPVGVGSLAAAAVRRLGGGPVLVSVEPEGAACLLASLAAGDPVSVPGPHPSIMAGLNCGTVSSAAWPLLRDAIALAVEVPDAAAADGMRTLRGLGIAAGECAGGVVGAAAALLTGPHRPGLPDGATVVLPLTEGVTDPAAYERLVSAPPR